MAQEVKDGIDVPETQTNSLNEQQDENEEKVPPQGNQNGAQGKTVQEEKKDQEKEPRVDQEKEATGNGKGKEGDPENPSQPGTSSHTPHTETEQNAADNNIRNAAIQAAKKMSYNLQGMHIHSWGNIVHRPNTGSAALGCVRVGDIGYVVHNPTKKFLEAPLGYPVLIDTSKGRKGPGGMGVPNNAVVLPDLKKMDTMNIQAYRSAAGVLENTEASLTFDQNFSHMYYSSGLKNFQRGRIIFDSDTQKLAILIMEITHKGKWVKAGTVAIQMNSVLLSADLKIGTEVVFSTQICGSNVVAHSISPCALLSEAETEYNTRARLPAVPSEFIAELSSATNKTMGTHNLKLLFRELGRENEKRIGEKKWGELEEHLKNPVDIFITDNSEGTYPATAVVLGLTKMIARYQLLPGAKAPNPLCWDFVRTGISPEQLELFDKAVVEKGIGLTVVVEANETSQKLCLEWARSAIATAVAGRNIDTKKAFIDSVGVTCSFGNYVTAQNFNELVSDSFYDSDKTVGLQSIKIFDQKVPAIVTFCPRNSEKVTIDTDLATRGLVVMSLEAVSKKVSEEDRLSVIETVEATKASAFYRNNREVQIKFRTTIENCKLFDKINKEYKLRIYYDNNPASRYAGKKPSKGFRTLKFSSVGWSEEQYLDLLSEIHSLKNSDFFVMKLGDMVGGNDEKWTRFTIGTEDFRTNKFLAALKLKLPLMQIMGINGFMTRIAVKGEISFEAIEAAVLAVGRFLPNVIKFVVHNNKIRKYNKQEHKPWNYPQQFQPHFSNYVAAVAGFPCPLDEGDVLGFLELADVDATDAAFTWYATESGDFVLQITTSKEEQISQLRERVGGQHDVTTFLKWTPQLFQSLRYVATLGQKLVIERDSSIVLPTARSPLSEREIAAIVNDGAPASPATADTTVSPTASAASKDTEWSLAGSRNKNKKKNQNATAKQATASSTTQSPPPSSSSSSSAFSALANLEEEEEEGVEVNEEQSTLKETPRVNNEETKTQKKKRRERVPLNNSRPYVRQSAKKLELATPKSLTRSAGNTWRTKNIRSTIYDTLQQKSLRNWKRCSNWRRSKSSQKSLRILKSMMM